MTQSKARPFPAATINPESRPFWDAATRGKLLISKCNHCGKAYFYPRCICPFCASTDTTWTEASGDGVIYSYSTMRRAPERFTLAYVTLKEGPKMLTNIVDCDPDKLYIGQKVCVVFKAATEGPPIPAFTPA